MNKKFHSFLYLLILSSLLPISCSKNEPTNQVPTCTIISPGNDERIEQGQKVNISVNADDKDGNISEVSFYINNIAVGLTNTSPYIFEWNTTDEEVGQHSIKAIAIDNIGASASDEISITLNGIPPIAEFEVIQPTIGQGKSITFTNQSLNDPTSYKWDFGDGNSSILKNPTHTYTSVGNYTISLTVENDYGSDIETKINYITVTIGGDTGTVTDYDGNIYKTISLGTQIWMAENLKVTHFTDGTEIKLVESSNEWNSLGYTDKAMCYYDNSEQNAEIYGGLYTWAAAKDACPSGWHLPDDSEWKQLEIYLGMSQEEADQSDNRGTNEGSKLAGNSKIWNDGHLENDNFFGISGFVAIPGGTRYRAEFDNLGTSAFFWSGSEREDFSAWFRQIGYFNTVVRRLDYYKNSGASVRCIKD